MPKFLLFFAKQKKSAALMENIRGAAKTATPLVMIMHYGL